MRLVRLMKTRLDEIAQISCGYRRVEKRDTESIGLTWKRGVAALVSQTYHVQVHTVGTYRVNE